MADSSNSSGKRSTSSGSSNRTGSGSSSSRTRPQRGGKGRSSAPGSSITGDRRTGASRSAPSRDTRPPRRDSGDHPKSGQRPSTPRPDSRTSRPDEFDDGLGEIDVSTLPRDVVADLEVLSAGVRVRVERLLAAARLALEEDPQQACVYAQEASRIGGRSSVVREAAGIAAYQAGEFASARKDLQAARRIGGRDDLIPLIADCERALGNPRKAVDLANSDEAKRLRGETQAELLLVAAGARLDMDQTNAAVSLLRGPCSNTPANAAWAGRIYYGYAEALLASGETELARDWFVKAAGADHQGVTDASDRVDEIDSAS